jgi:PTH1 family peptidyl-tRNA hydrolase
MVMDRGMVLVIGLGNPGTDYENTYHNVGALAVDELSTAMMNGGGTRWETYKKLFSYTQTDGWIFVKPLTFMNVSGAAARAAARKFDLPPEHMVVIHDDSDLPLGTFKISRARGAAGHHGIESIVAALGTNDFTRVRIGIRPPHEIKRKKAEDLVLKTITKSSAAVLREVFAAAGEKLKNNIFSS